MNDTEKLNKLLSELELLAKDNPSVEKNEEHWGNGNFDDSFDHGWECGAGSVGDSVRDLVAKFKKGLT